MSGTLTILQAGPAMTVQDLGRPGYRALGLTHGGAADPTHLVLLLHGLLGGALSALLWPLSDADDPVLPQMGRLLMRPLLGGLCALILCQLLALGVLRLGSDGESAWRLAAFVAGFGERLFTRLR